MESGPKYVTTIEGILQLVVIIFSCTTFALFAASGQYDTTSQFQWIFAAYIVSFCISFLLFVCRLSGLSDHIRCGSGEIFSYDGFDFFWAWFCTIWCTAASITFAVNFNVLFQTGNTHSEAYGECVASVCLGFVTSVLYGVEAFFLRVRAPMNMGYVATLNGWICSLLVGFGAATFGLLVDSGWNWCGSDYSCKSGMTYALAVYCIAWTVTTILWLVHMGTNKTQTGPAMQFEVAWSVLSAVLFITASSCFAAYMKCSGDDFDTKTKCQKRLTGVIIGFLTAVLYVVNVVILREHMPLKKN